MTERRNIKNEKMDKAIEKAMLSFREFGGGTAEEFNDGSDEYIKRCSEFQLIKTLKALGIWNAQMGR